ncbi:MAG TPA: hypothetical protein VN688_03150 [Gemmataceae bacterium]|nr:hypothetical protein [Gemmataceae bacterium]
MGRASILLLVGLAILGGTAGCSLGHRCRCIEPADASAATELALPTAERNTLEADMLALALSLKPIEPPDDPPPPSAYRALEPKQCQCLAARHAPAADSLDRQRQKLAQQRTNGFCLCNDRKSASQRAFQESMLLYSALEIRDQFAGTALEWYYQLAGAEAKADLLDTSLERGRDTLARMERLKKEGIRLPAPIEEYQRRLVGLQLQQAQNQLVIEQLNSKLRQALGFNPSHTWRFRPDPSLPLGSEAVPDIEAAVRLGLAERPQLLLLRGMITHLDKDTLDAARKLLGSISPMLGMSSPKSGCKMLTILAKVTHIQPRQKDEVESVRAHLIDYLRERERVVVAEIREAAYEVRARREVTILAREASGRWQERIKDLEKQQGQGMPVFADLTTSYMESYKARGEVVKEFLGWKIAAVKVKQAQGILPAECGYTSGNSCGSFP